MAAAVFPFLAACSTLPASRSTIQESRPLAAQDPSAEKPAPAAQQGRLDSHPADTAFSAGLGLTDSPDTFLTVLEGGWYLRENLAFAPMLQLGVADDETIIAPTVDLKAYLPLPDLDPIRLHVLGGIGFAYLEKEGRRGDDDDIGLLVHFGFGGNYPLSDELSLGSSVLFNVMPKEVLDEQFFLSWEIFSVTFRF